ncbi:hypothetical protein KC19_VG158900 [Ceratodon purpureus]|uniref:Uncharacterized protein n=1 Tax=Ceratodon purpureus TaxID=3225 RepID=A0A8T0HQZ5_CERPU|nr:hypothetical protein KC19_VG158900 [Ceratodon purpureus]
MDAPSLTTMGAPPPSVSFQIQQDVCDISLPSPLQQPPPHAPPLPNQSPDSLTPSPTGPPATTADSADIFVTTIAENPPLAQPVPALRAPASTSHSSQPRSRFFHIDLQRSL